MLTEKRVKRSLKRPTADHGPRHVAPGTALHHQGNESDHETSQRIVTAATRLFAEKGYAGVSIEDICTAADANIAAVHYHFGSKVGLFRHIVEQFATEKWEAARKLLQPPSTRDEMKVRLEIFLRQLIEAVISQPDIFTIIQRWFETTDIAKEDFFKAVASRNFEAMVEFFKQAKKKGLIADDIDPFYAAANIGSLVGHTISNAKMIKISIGYSLEDEKTRERWIQQTVRIFLNGVLKKGDR